MVKLPEDSGVPAFVAQRIEHLTTDQKVGGSSPSKRTVSQRQHLNGSEILIVKCVVCAKQVSDLGCNCDRPQLSKHLLGDTNAELYGKISTVDISHPIQGVEDLKHRGWSDAKLINRHLSKREGSCRVLEIGPGLGHLGNLLHENFDYYAADLVPNYLNELGLEQGKSFLWDVSLGGIHEEFDAIVACDVFEHVLNEGDAWLSVHDALKSRGFFYLRVPFREPLTNYATLLGAPYPYVHLRSYSLSYLKEMASYSGFKVKKIRKSYNFEAVYSRRDFGVPLIRKLRAYAFVSSLRLAYGPKPQGSPDAHVVAANSTTSPSVGFPLLVFSRLSPRLQSLIRSVYVFLSKSTVVLLYRPTEVALVLEKRY